MTADKSSQHTTVHSTNGRSVFIGRRSSRVVPGHRARLTPLFSPGELNEM